MRWRKIPLIDVIKINSKKILDTISKYEGGINEIKAGRNKYCSKNTYDKITKKARDASATIINKVLKYKLVNI